MLHSLFILIFVLAIVIMLSSLVINLILITKGSHQLSRAFQRRAKRSSSND